MKVSLLIQSPMSLDEVVNFTELILGLADATSGNKSRISSNCARILLNTTWKQFINFFHLNPFLAAEQLFAQYGSLSIDLHSPSVFLLSPFHFLLFQPHAYKGFALSLKFFCKA
jgi:hypothetical protein